jgi:regulator of replication initiation timing
MGSQMDELEGRADELIEMINGMKVRAGEIIAETRKAREVDNENFKTALTSILSSIRKELDAIKAERKQSVWHMFQWAVVAGLVCGVIILAFLKITG